MDDTTWYIGWRGKFNVKYGTGIDQLHLKFCIHVVLHVMINQGFKLLMDISRCGMKIMEQDTVEKCGSVRPGQIWQYSSMAQKDASCMLEN
jgi:hypothetical protein